jgi:hypothetical protein
LNMDHDDRDSTIPPSSRLNNYLDNSALGFGDLNNTYEHEHIKTPYTPRPERRRRSSFTSFILQKPIRDKKIKRNIEGLTLSLVIRRTSILNSMTHCYHSLRSIRAHPVHPQACKVPSRLWCTFP